MKNVETMIVRTLVPITDKNGTNLCELIWLQRDFADQSVQSPIAATWKDNKSSAQADEAYIPDWYNCKIDTL